MTIPAPIRSADESELEVIGELLARAFDEPVTRWLVPDPARHRPVMSRFFALIAADALTTGTVDLVSDDGGHPVAAALWFDQSGPDQTTDPDPDTPDPRWDDVFGPDAARWRILEDLMTHHHLAGPHWYLMAIGVHPAMRGHGLGSLLLNHGRHRLGGVPAYLEATSTDSRRLYHRHGYTDLGQIPVPDGPPLWRMWTPTDPHPVRTGS